MKTTSRLRLAASGLLVGAILFSGVTSFPASARRGADDTAQASTDINSVDSKRGDSLIEDSSKSTAQTEIEAARKLKPLESGQMCARLDDVTIKVDGGLEDRLTKVATKRGDASENLAQNRLKQDQKLQEIRTAADKDRAAQYAALEAKATTDAEKQAVKDFEATLNAAIATRRAAIDAAIKAYREGVDALIASHQADINTAIAQYKAAADAALATAKVSCAAGTDAKIVRTTFVSAMKTARTNLKTAIDNVAGVKDSVQPLIKTRKAAVDKAWADFTVAAKAARDKLKQAFGDTTQTTD